MTFNLEFGALVVPVPGRAAAAAAGAEADGYDVALMTDSQNLNGDPYVALALAAKATDKIRIGTGVTNPITRHPASAASAILSIQAESGGRAILGIGRGDSALAHIGRQPAPLKVFRLYVTELQAYLSGQAVDQNGFPSRIRWLDQVTLPKVPLDVACTGPQVISVAASVAERVTFAVGAAPERVEWALKLARDAAAKAGRDPETIRFGAWINTAAMASREEAREAVRGHGAAFAHFSGMAGAPVEEQPDFLRRTSLQLRSNYDTHVHARAEAAHARMLTDEFLDWFCVAGPPDYVIERSRALLALGLDHLYFVGAMMRGSRELFAREVLPGLHEQVGQGGS